ncbi:GLOBIN domain-containing protein [Aphelenchoides bicaudatus]|nr:GLOBIN domain-containing protein [Aphelenchoides bicaudatus]
MRPSPTSNNHLAPRPLRRCRSASPAFPRAPLLTTDQQNLIRKSWTRISKTNLGQSIYIRMSGKCSDMPKFFEINTGVVERHQKYFIDLIQNSVDNLADVDGALKPWLDQIAKAHTGFQIKSKHWDAFTEAMLSNISEWIGPSRSHRETIRAWMILISYLADRLSSSASNSNSPVFTPRLQLLSLTPTTPV